MTTTLDTTGTAQEPAGRPPWIDHWEPEDPAFWAAGGASVARRNLIFSILSEHIGFSIWTMWSVLVLFLGPKYGFKPEDKFLLKIVPALVGSLLRLPLTFAVATSAAATGRSSAPCCCSSSGPSRSCWSTRAPNRPCRIARPAGCPAR